MARRYTWLALALALAPLVGAGCSYKPSSFDYYWHPFAGQRLTGACLDLGIGRDDQGYTLGPVIGYTFGNRCEHRVTVDLASLRVVAHGIDGSVTPLHAYDPNAEIRPATLVALGAGQELIEYRDSAGTPAARTADVCVDIGAIEPESPRGERWVCVGGPR